MSLRKRIRLERVSYGDFFRLRNQLGSGIEVNPDTDICAVMKDTPHYTKSQMLEEVLYGNARNFEFRNHNHFRKPYEIVDGEDKRVFLSLISGVPLDLFYRHSRLKLKPIRNMPRSKRHIAPYSATVTQKDHRAYDIQFYIAPGKRIKALNPEFIKY